MKKIMLTLCLFMASSLSVHAFSEGSWVKEEAGWAYYNVENMRLSGWIQDQYQCWYMLDYDSGIMKTGWVAENSDWYYLNPDNGIMQDSKWITENSTSYYLLPNGKMAVGLVEIDGVSHLFAENGSYLGEASQNDEPLPPDSDLSESSYERSMAEQVIDQVNEYRAEAGLKALSNASAALQNAADIRVNELAADFSHERPDGSYFATVLDEVGIDTYYYAENIAFEYQSVDEAMDFWMHSESHRINILNESFNEIAVSLIPSSTGYLWAMICIGE